MNERLNGSNVEKISNDRIYTRRKRERERERHMHQAQAHTPTMRQTFGLYCMLTFQ